MNKSYFKILTISLIISFGVSYISNILFINQANAQEVQGISVSATEEEKAVALIQPSVVRILTTYCGSFGFEGDLAVVMDGVYKDYEFCTGAKGSGFIISPDGYIATNGHVVSFSDDDKLRIAFFSTSVIELYVDILAQLDFITSNEVYTEYEKQLVIEQILTDPDVWEAAVLKMAEFYDTGWLTLTDNPETIFVQKGNSIFEFNDATELINKADHYEAELIAADYEAPEFSSTGEVTFNSSDVAILKVDAVNLPAVEIGNIADLNVGTPIIVLGFPGKADSPIVSEKSESQVTVTSGVVSSIKQDTNDKHLIQTDASIAHGNSGGPAISRSGEVVGIATYVTIPEAGTGDESGDFNFLRDIKDLTELADKNNVNYGRGSVDTLWLEGLELFWNAKFTKANLKFEEVKSLQPEHKLVQNYIDRATQAIQNGEENKEWKDYVTEYIEEDQIPFVVGGVVGFCLVSLIFLVLLNTFLRGGKKRNSIPPIPQAVREPQAVIQPLGNTSVPQRIQDTMQVSPQTQMAQPQTNPVMQASIAQTTPTRDPVAVPVQPIINEQTPSNFASNTSMVKPMVNEVHTTPMSAQTPILDPVSVQPTTISQPQQVPSFVDQMPEPAPAPIVSNQSQSPYGIVDPLDDGAAMSTDTVMPQQKDTVSIDTVKMPEAKVEDVMVDGFKEPVPMQSAASMDQSTQVVEEELPITPEPEIEAIETVQNISDIPAVSPQPMLAATESLDTSMQKPTEIITSVPDPVKVTPVVSVQPPVNQQIMDTPMQTAPQVQASPSGQISSSQDNSKPRRKRFKKKRSWDNNKGNSVNVNNQQGMTNQQNVQTASATVQSTPVAVPPSTPFTTPIQPTTSPVVSPAVASEPVANVSPQIQPSIDQSVQKPPQSIPTVNTDDLPEWLRPV